jgi:hypothetical protein
MEGNNISKYCSDLTMEGGIIAIGFSAINMSSLQPLPKLAFAITPREKVE